MHRTSIFQSGFTLIEIIVVIIVLGILGAISVTFINYTVDGYVAQTRRAALVDDTTLVLSRMARDIRSALPNSVRVDPANHAIELLHVCAAGRYRDGPGSSGANNYSGAQYRLQFNRADDQFNIAGTLDACNPAATHAVVYNIGIAGADAYSVGGTPNVITPDGTTIAIDDAPPEAHITLAPAFQFKYQSPGQRIYFINTPISWACDPASNTLTRYSGYPINAAQSIPAAAFGALATNDVAGCNFQYTAGTTQRAGVATLSLTLTRDGESVRLLDQVHVVNAP
ncbi:MAG TPA: prepilin-type N-terminal cleavage/methylation domain-containing protein [Gammaproteobacteria bacterium]|nr:prepilin-type N-terminal cleavage/methylation domain-containing protein [Gammaproteobacteria bacterium]